MGSMLLYVAFVCTVRIVAISHRYNTHLLHNGLAENELEDARTFGAQGYEKFLMASSNSSFQERLDLYDEYFMTCNRLGQDRAKEVFNQVAAMKTNKDIKLLLAMGMSSFVARFTTMDLKDFNKGIKNLCEKFELQLQCQLGFGESRTQVLLRIDSLKTTDGNLGILLERQCPHPEVDNSVYHCFSKNVEGWTSPCFESMLAYNYTRYSAGRRITRLHINATAKVAELTANKNLTDNDQFLTLKQHVGVVFNRALRAIAEIEGEKCEALGKVMGCVLPLVEDKCGEEAAEILRTSVLVGYLTNQRKEPLASQFEGFGVEKSKKCLDVHPLI